jgi:hypothetical protein
LEGFFVDDALVGEGFEDGFVFLAGVFLFLGLGFFAAVFLVGVPGKRGGAAEDFPGTGEADPVGGAAEDFDPVGAGGGARGEEDGVAVANAGEAGGVVGVPKEFLGRGLEKGVAEQ